MEAAAPLRGLFLSYLSSRVLPASSTSSSRIQEDEKELRRVSVEVGSEVFLLAMVQQPDRRLTFRDLLDDTLGPVFLPEGTAASREFVLVDQQGRVFMLDSDAEKVIAFCAEQGGPNAAAQPQLKLVYRGDPVNVNPDFGVDGEEEVGRFEPRNIHNEFGMDNIHDKQTVTEEDTNTAQQQQTQTLKQFDENLRKLNKRNQNKQEPIHTWGFHPSIDLKRALDLNRRERRQDLMRKKRTVLAAKLKLKQTEENEEQGNVPHIMKSRESRRRRGSVFRKQEHARAIYKDRLVLHSTFRAIWAIILAGLTLAATSLWIDNNGEYSFFDGLLFAVVGPRTAFFNTQLNRFKFKDITIRSDVELFLQDSLPVTLYTFSDQNQAAFLLGRNEGVVRLRQVRSSLQSPCNAQGPGSFCYPSYTPEDESRAPFGSCGETFDFEPSYSSDEQSPYFTTYLSPSMDPGGLQAFYDSSGGFFQFADGPNNLTNLLAVLFADCWLDEGIRAIMAEYNIYNINVDLFAAVKVIFEFDVTGDINSVVSIRIFNGLRPLSQNPEKLAGFILVLIVICGVIVRMIFALFVSVGDANQEGNYMENARQILPWLTLDIVVGIFFLAGMIQGVVWYQNPERVNLLLNGVDPNANYVELYDYGRQAQISGILFVYGTGLAILGLLRVGYLFSQGNVFLRTIEMVSPSLASLIIFMIAPYFLIMACVGFINVNGNTFNTFSMAYITTMNFPSPGLMNSQTYQNQYIVFINFLLVLAVLYKLLLSGIFTSRIITEFSQVSNEDILESMGVDVDDIDDIDIENEHHHGGTKRSDAGLMHAFRVFRRWWKGAEI